MAPIIVPDRITPVRAWRAWAISPRLTRFGLPLSGAPQWRLRSLILQDVWPPLAALAAACARCADSVPSRDCTCGIHALRAPDDLLNYLQALQPWWSSVIVGPVLLWGTVVEHERGYRAQYATMGGAARLYADPAFHALAIQAGGALARDYGVPIEIVPLPIENRDPATIAL